MKAMLILIFFSYTSFVMACSCDYDYGSRSRVFLNRAAGVIGDVKAEDLSIVRYDLQYTVMARFDPTAYGRYSCGCSSFVKRIWDFSYEKGGAACEARVILQVWNDKMKLQSEKCE